jgi:hypothetical protein
MCNGMGEFLSSQKTTLSNKAGHPVCGAVRHDGVALQRVRVRVFGQRCPRSGFIFIPCSFSWHPRLEMTVPGIRARGSFLWTQPHVSAEYMHS